MFWKRLEFENGIWVTNFCEIVKIFGLMDKQNKNFKNIL